MNGKMGKKCSKQDGLFWKYSAIWLLFVVWLYISSNTLLIGECNRICIWLTVFFGTKQRQFSSFQCKNCFVFGFSYISMRILFFTHALGEKDFVLAIATFIAWNSVFHTSLRMVWRTISSTFSPPNFVFHNQETALYCHKSILSK